MDPIPGPGNGRPKFVLSRVIITHFSDGDVNLRVEPDGISAIQIYGLLEIAHEIFLKARIAPAAAPSVVPVRRLPPGLEK